MIKDITISQIKEANIIAFGIEKGLEVETSIEVDKAVQKQEQHQKQKQKQKQKRKQSDGISEIFNLPSDPNIQPSYRDTSTTSNHVEEEVEEEKYHSHKHRRYHVEPPETSNAPSQEELFRQRNHLLYGRLDQLQKKSPNFSSSLSLESTAEEHARLLEDKMGETPPAAPPSRVRQRNTGGGGEIVEVQGGHIVRSTGRKDRHSKVCTAKGPRDRRVRLAAHTAIQFYDVQDRLGYDRPSKAVDWLIKKAKSSIDELAQLPPWHPTNTTPPSSSAPSFQQEEDRRQHQQQHHDDLMINSISGPSGNNPNTHSLSFLPPSLDSDAIADTIKSFFPMGASADASSSAMQFHNSQDLRLSLQSFAQDPILLHHHNTEQTHQQQHIQGQVLLSGIPLGFDGTGGWAAEHHHHQQAADLSRFHRHAASWNSGGSDGAAAGYLFSSNSPQLQQLLGENQNQNQFISQRGPLQSSNTPAIRAWMDPSTADHGGQQQYHHLLPIYPPSISATGFSSGGGGFSGFHIPARFQGDQEEHDGYPDKPSSASSDSRH